jgi:hypothetical protein
MNDAPMAKGDLTNPTPAPASQATHIEQSRAIAQVQGALVVAQERPRDTLAAWDRMREGCQVQALADLAFFRFNRGGSQVSGPSIHLATELARCWGNIDYGVSELSRNDQKGESEMLTYAWDLETNTKAVNTFIVPHKRDKRGGPQTLVDMRDIYENNANAGARRLRECILKVVPKAFVEEAKATCMSTLQDGGGVPIEIRREKLLQAFAAMGITRVQIEAKIGHAADRLTANDIGALRVVYGSLQRGESNVSDEFQTDTGGEIAAELNQSTTQAEDDASTDGTAHQAAMDAVEDELANAPEPWKAKYDEAMQAFAVADNAGSLELLLRVYEVHFVAMPDEAVTELRGFYATRKAELEKAAS